MIRTKLMRATVALTLMATLPAIVVAQDTPATPEGVEWHLTTYADGSGMTAVPWSIDATLLLEDGTASGSNGCNHFSGGYELVGEELTFGDTLGVTLMACLGSYDWEAGEDLFDLIKQAGQPWSDQCPHG